jgi:ribosome-associated heat shock protein Hsp15
MPAWRIRECRTRIAYVGAKMEQARIDKWLWAARFFKTRSAATRAVLGGRAHVNGVRVKPAHEVHPGDTVEVTTRSDKWVVDVVAIADRRGSAAAAAALYLETPESTSAREQAAIERRLATPPGMGFRGRPTKLDRRRLDALRRAHRQKRSS